MTRTDNKAMIEKNQEITPAFKVGDVVIYTNPQGVCFGRKTVVGTAPAFEPEAAARGEVRYYISPTDTPWFSVQESCLSFPRVTAGRQE